MNSAHTRQQFLQEIEWAREFFLRALRAFTETDSEFAPHSGMFTVAQQVAHVGQTAAWFVGGLHTAFNMDLEEHDRETRKFTSLKTAVQYFNENLDAFKQAIANASDELLDSPFAPSGPLTGPRSGVVFGFIDHTAHHRGSLALYARALGRTPVMPYVDL